MMAGSLSVYLSVLVVPEGPLIMVQIVMEM